MELRQLRTFEAVLEHGTITDAALAVGMAPSSISAQIQALEASLGTALFERSPAGMRPTEAGGRLRRWARRLLDQADQARHEVTGVSACLRLGALETIAATHVPRVLATLRERRPGLRVEVHPARSRDDLLADVTAARLDAALVLDTGTTLGDLGFPRPAAPLTFLDVDTVPLALVANPSHPLCGSAGLVPEDLSEQRLLVNVPNCSFRLAADQLIGPGPERVQANGVAVMRAWAEQGLGLALLPEFAVATALRTGTVSRLDLPSPDLNLRLVWRADREEVPGVRDILYAASAPTDSTATALPRGRHPS